MQTDEEEQNLPRWTAEAASQCPSSLLQPPVTEVFLEIIKWV